MNHPPQDPSAGEEVEVMSCCECGEEIPCGQTYYVGPAGEILCDVCCPGEMIGERQ